MALDCHLILSSNFLKLKGFTNSLKDWQRLAPNAGSPFLRGSMQKLIAFENNFLRGKKQTQNITKTHFLNSLELLWYFAAQKVHARRGLRFAEAWLHQDKPMFSSAWQRSRSLLGSLFCKKTTAAISERCLWSGRTPDAPHHTPQGYSNAMRHLAPKDGLEPGRGTPVFTVAP